MSQSSPFPSSPSKDFLWSAASRYFISAPKNLVDCAEQDRALVRELCFVSPESTRNALAASLSLLLDRDLTGSLAGCEAERFRPGMVIIYRPKEDDGPGRPAFMLGGFVNYDVAMFTDGTLSDNLPGNAPDNPFVRQAAPDELEATLANMPEPVAERIARCVIASILLTSDGSGEAIDRTAPEL